MATKLIHCRRVVTYLPNLRAAVIQSKAFSSASDQFEPTPPEAAEDSPRVQTVWPDHMLGPLGPQDKRFPLPGCIGPCVNTRRLAQDLNAKPVLVSPGFDINAVLPPLPEHRHFDIAEQFLTSVDEIVVEFVESDMSRPSATDKMEYRAHACPDILRKEFKELFPDRNIQEGDLTIVNISLKTENDMTLWSSEVEEEREALLETFIQGAVEICQAFEDSGFWADFIEPTSGKPFKGPHTNFTLFETDERYRRMGFDILDLGCCKVITHPVWGTNAYIGTLFSNAPLNHPLVTCLKPDQ
ncbi:cobalamin trafficking protein CblD [Aplysia californica]|uniref:Cobalamin trafficking protein CblD n=1 Tax=Aplysia californica TaxID=6500 RepID=A0ABM0JNE2_APLCA|nr:cobalamin trafficking protein CblD [Aplysia californica]XP_005097768.1 cobalamin trafficking protein CblD [Aplysia californica]XP_035825497.1 cobalamin trafficking protein CblD [Aplysia californica]